MTATKQRAMVAKGQEKLLIFNRVLSSIKCELTAVSFGFGFFDIIDYFQRSFQNFSPINTGTPTEIYQPVKDYRL